MTVLEQSKALGSPQVSPTAGYAAASPSNETAPRFKALQEGGSPGARVINIHAGQCLVLSDGVSLLSDGLWANALNVAFAFAGLVVLAPLMLVVAAAIGWMNRGPIFYRGYRLGRGGQPFLIYKFRTMRADAEAQLGRRLMHPADGLVNPLGRYLRRAKLDELPQLWNVLRRDMNLVGPRPVRPLMAYHYASMTEHYGDRFACRPGITGLAQMAGGYYCSPKRKTSLDRKYVRRRRLSYDLRLLAATPRYLVEHVLHRR